VSRIGWPLPPVRLLPRPIAPIHHETLSSYLGRLAAANHLTAEALRAYLRDPATHRKPVMAWRLAAVTSRPVDALRQALPELRPAEPDDRSPFPRSAMADFHHQPRIACRLCAAASGATSAVAVWVAHHIHVCIRHRRWIGPTNRYPRDQLDLSGLPDVVAAARHHRNLVRRHGAHHTRHAFEQGHHIALRWAERRDFGRQHRSRRLVRLGWQPEDHYLWIPPWEPAVRAAVYPEAVTLTSLIASPYWSRVAALDRERFYDEVARRLHLPDYAPYTSYDPLDRWASNHRGRQLRFD